MSDQLTISASFSVLMMAIFVMFGSESARAPFGTAQLETPAALEVPAMAGKPSLFAQ